MEPALVKLSIDAAISAGRAILQVYQTPFTVEQKEDKSPLTLADKDAHEIIHRRLTETGIPVLSEEGKMIQYDERRDWKELWVVDPLDGTKEFIKRNGEFTVNIALVKNGISVFGIIYQPVTDVLYFGGLGMKPFKVTDAAKKADGDLMTDAIDMKNNSSPEIFTIVASRSHLSPETLDFIEKEKKRHGTVNFISSGSSLKLCMLAEARAHIYPRFAPTMEWDTAAGHAILKAAGKNIYSFKTGDELQYNKPDLLNDWFIAK
jgi:3'(2'), 5'-bisphosphate nucleotidase